MSVLLQNTADEHSAAAQTKAVEHGQQEAPVLRTDSLATSSLIYSALSAFPTAAAGAPLSTEEKQIKGMKDMAQRLSKNTLSSWYKGALLTAGTRAEIEDVWGKRFADQCYSADGKEMTAWLRELRRSYGNTWEGCMAAAKFLEEYQNSKLRTEMFNVIPALSTLDNDGTSVKGWAEFNSKGDTGKYVFASKGDLSEIEKKLAGKVPGF